MTEALQQEIRTLRSLFNSDRDPDGRVFAPLADAYRRSGELQEAVKLLNEGLTRLPDFVPGHVVAAQLYVEQGLAQEAEIAATSALKLDPENVNALRSLLRVLEERGDEPAAGEIRDRLLSLEPAVALEAAGSDHEVTDLEVDTLDMPALIPEPEPGGAEDVGLVDSLAEPSPPEADTSDLGLGAGDDFDLTLAQEEGTAGADGLNEEPVFDLDALASMESEVLGETPLESGDLAPEAEAREEQTVSLDALAPDGAEVAEEPVFDLDTLAPAESEVGAEAVGGSGDLTPDTRAEGEQIVSLDALAPDVEPLSEEPVFDLDALAPAAEAEEPVMEMGALAPEPEAEAEEPVMEMVALAPEPEARAEEPVIDVDALAPTTEEPVMEMAALAPDPEAQAEEPVIDVDALAPTAEEPVIDLDALAPGPPATADELVIDLDTLAPDPEPSVEEPPAEEPSSEEPVIDVDGLQASAESETPSEEAPAPEASEPETESEPEPEKAPSSETDDAPSGDDEPGEPIYTRTLASLYETQGAISEALRVLRRLHAADPDDRDLARRIGELEARLESMDGGEAPVEEREEDQEEEVETLARDLAQSGEGEHDVDSPFSWAEHEAEEEQPTGPTMKEYFEDLLSWEPGEES